MRKKVLRKYGEREAIRWNASVGKSGYAVAHVSYITRLSALDPEGRERAGLREQGQDQPSLFSHDDRVMTEPTAGETLRENLNEQALDNAGAKQNRSVADPIWTWNAPGFLTVHGYGVKPEFESQRAARPDRRLAKPDAQDSSLSKRRYRTSKITCVA